MQSAKPQDQQTIRSCESVMVQNLPLKAAKNNRKVYAIYVRDLGRLKIPVAMKAEQLID